MAATLPSPSRIYLLRHAEAVWPQPGQGDFDRDLSEKGYGDAEIVADHATDKNYQPDIPYIFGLTTYIKPSREFLRRPFGPTS